MRAVRFLLPAALLAGCLPVTVTEVAPRPSSSPPVASPAVPSPSPTASVVTMPSASTLPAPSPHTDGKTTIVTGTITDENGVAVEGANVHINSLSASIPYFADTTSSQGQYLVNSLPEDLNVEVVVSKPGWTTRRRVGAFRTTADHKNVLDFGGAAPEGAAYFISSYPEVAATDPSFGQGAPVDPTTVQYKLTLSEPLDAANRLRFEDAIRLAPTTVSLAGDALSDVMPDQLLPTAIRKGTLFYAVPAIRATVGWNEAGTEATLAFNAPLPKSRTSLLSYQAYLVSTGEPIVDADGHPLGQATLNRWAPVPAGALVRRAFYQSNVIKDANLTAGDRWAATHVDKANYNVQQDSTAPHLTAVTFQDGHLTLTFDEPMCAYGGGSGGIAPGLDGPDRLAGLSFAYSSQLRLDGYSAQSDLEITAAQLADPDFVFTTREREFRFDPKAQNVALKPNPMNPKEVFLSVTGHPKLFDSSAGTLEVRVQGIADVAGNLPTPQEADAHVVRCSLN